jgi:hypothetical protein
MRLRHLPVLSQRDSVAVRAQRDRFSRLGKASTSAAAHSAVHL